MSPFVHLEAFSRVLQNGSTRALRLFGSLKLAVILLVVLAVVLAWATFLEAERGADFARWYVYGSVWFSALLTVLGINILSTTLLRFPWKKRQFGFVVTHAGLLVLLVGSIVSFLGGIEGRVSLVEGETATDMVVGGRSQITAHWVGRPEEAPYEFVFAGGPVVWPEGRSLEIGKVDGVQATVLSYYSQAETVESWIEDERYTGGPLVRFKLQDSDGRELVESWLADTDFGGELFVGPLQLQLVRAVTDRLLEHFREPPESGLGKSGQLVMFYGDFLERVLVDESLGKPIPLGDSGVQVEIAEYLPNARPAGMGTFKSAGDRPENPMLELRVRLSEDQPPLRQIAFAKNELLNLDGVYGHTCPVKFRYYHPDVASAAAFELLQTSDGTLYGRVVDGGEIDFRGKIQAGDAIPVPGGFTLSVVEYLPHAKRQVDFSPVNVTKSENRQQECVVHVEIVAGGVTRRVWMRRNDPQYGTQSIVTPQGTMHLSFGYARVPLGYSLKLLEFQRDLNPGRVGNAAFSSHVRLVDKKQGIDQERKISMNQPLTHGKFTFYQSGFDDAGHGRQVSSLSVAYDPGRLLKYAGSLMICVGIAIMFCMRAYFFRNLPTLWRRRARSPSVSDSAAEATPRIIPAPSGRFVSLLSRRSAKSTVSQSKES